MEDASIHDEDSWKDSDFLVFGDGNDNDDDDNNNNKTTKKDGSAGTGGDATHIKTTVSKKSERRRQSDSNSYSALAGTCLPTSRNSSSNMSISDSSSSRYNNNNNNNKRSLSSSSSLLTAAARLPPWMDEPHGHRFHYSTPKLVLLHEEIVQFVKLMEPQPLETQTRNDFVKVVKELILNLFNGDGENDTNDGDDGKHNGTDKKNKKCEVHVFGSHATGLSLPSSDIDFVVLLPGHEEETNSDGNNGNGNSDSQKSTTASDASNANSKSSITKKGGKGKNGEEGGGKKEANTTLTKEQEQKEMDEYDVHKHSSKAKNNTSISPLIRLADELKAKWGGKTNELTYLEVVENTKVPIVKFTHGPTNLSVDICFNQYNGVQNAELVKRFMEAMPPLRPLTFLLKYFLAARGLNEPYSGGIGSFTLQMMIVSFLQQRERYEYNKQLQSSSSSFRGRNNIRSRSRGRDDYYYDNYDEYQSPPMNLGSLLIEFFELYGMDFNYLTTAISVRNDGSYFPKGHHTRKEHFFTNPSRAFSLGIENPIDTTMDVGKVSFRMQLIQKSFEIALRVLLGHVAEPALRADSILASILPPTEEMYKRATMYKVLQIERQLKKQGYHVNEQRNNQRNNRGYNNHRGNTNNSESKSKRRRKSTDSSMELSESD